MERVGPDSCTGEGGCAHGASQCPFPSRPSIRWALWRQRWQREGWPSTIPIASLTTARYDAGSARQHQPTRIIQPRRIMLDKWDTRMMDRDERITSSRSLQLVLLVSAASGPGARHLAHDALRAAPHGRIPPRARLHSRSFRLNSVVYVAKSYSGSPIKTGMSAPHHHHHTR